MAHYESLNFVDVDSLYSEDELILRASIRDFVEKDILPALQEANRNEQFPMDLIPRFGEMGLLGPTIDGYGCAGLGDVAYGLIMQELERGDSGIRSFCSVQGALVMYPIFAFGSETQKSQYLPQLATG